jgi:hypothetical protein
MDLGKPLPNRAASSYELVPSIQSILLSIQENEVTFPARSEASNISFEQFFWPSSRLIQHDCEGSSTRTGKLRNRTSLALNKDFVRCEVLKKPFQRLYLPGSLTSLIPSAAA